MNDTDRGTPRIAEPAEVRRVLSAIRYEQALSDTPLAEMDAVWDLLLREGVAPSAEGRAWALGELIHEVVQERLDEARRKAGVTPHEDAAPADTLSADFSAGSAELEVWSALYHRYLDPGQMQAGEIAAEVGMPRRTLGRRLVAARRRLAMALSEREREAARSLRERTDLPIVDARVTIPAADGGNGSESDGATDASAVDATDDALLRAVRGTGERRLPVAPEALERLATEQPADLQAYRLSRVAAWSRPAYRVDARFVDLTLLVDRGEKVVDRWQAEPEVYDDLGAVLAAVASQVIVLLGPPGSGKSTLLRRMELDLASAGLREETDAVPFLVSLGRYWADREAGGLQSPESWLESNWDRRYPDLPPFRELLDAGRLVLLLDGLNEMPHAGFDDYRARILSWKRFLRETVVERPGLRVVFSCRSLDYGAPLSSPDLRVPQIRVEPMSDAQVRAFLHRYAPAQADAIWRGLEGAPRLELLRSPYLLTLLVEQALASGEAPVGRAALFTSFVRRALQREIEHDHPLFQPGPLLDERDYRRAISGRRWPTAWTLPERGALVPGLTALAYGMQSRSQDGRASQVRVGFDAAVTLIDHPAAEDILRGGNALGMLDEHVGRDEVMFFHQLLQEYFAARRLAADPEEAAARCRVGLRAEEQDPALEEVIEGLESTEPLPALPATGWEEIALLAASMSPAPEAFVEAVAAANAPLAARAAAQPEMAERLSDAVVDGLRARLIEMGGDAAFDLRARIEAGRALGTLGDPRFERREGPHGTYVMPPLVEVAGGRYPIGDDEPIVYAFMGAEGQAAAHVPRHAVTVGGFRIGRFPVTHAEFACFLAAGGYEHERWWATADARAWRRGELPSAGQKANNRTWRKRFQDQPELLRQMVAEERFASDEVAARWQGWMALDDAGFEAALADHGQGRLVTEPRFWHDGRFNHPSQPVVGLCWYEARAYCAWLAEQSGLAVRLPTEVEWEAAARGTEARAYAHGGAFDRLMANTLETHVNRTTPVGAFPDGRTPEGIDDLSGNVFEWTLSLYGDSAVDEYETEFPYPYDATDGREDADAPPDVRRVVRGGAWNNAHPIARTAFRDFNHPDYANDNYGFRVVVAER